MTSRSHFPSLLRGDLPDCCKSGSESLRHGDPMDWTQPGFCSDGIQRKVHRSEGRGIMRGTTTGLDIAKQVFQGEGMDEQGTAVLCRTLGPEQVPPFLANLRPCLVGLESCGRAQYWTRQLSESCHAVRRMTPPTRLAIESPRFVPRRTDSPSRQCLLR